MFRLAELRLATIIFLSVAALPLTAACAWAFSQGNGGSGGGSNSTFADPDEQVNIGQKGEAQAYGSNGAVQFSPHQLNSFKHSQSDSLTSPPDPLSRPHD
jgi:hypothetical protein